MIEKEKQEIRLTLAQLSKPDLSEINRNESLGIIQQINKETERLSKLDKLTKFSTRLQESKGLDVRVKKLEINRLMKKHSLTPKPGVVYEPGNLDRVHKELVDMDMLASAYPQFSRTQREEFNSFLQSRYPVATSIQNRITKKTKTNIENFIKSQSIIQREKNI